MDETLKLLIIQYEHEEKLLHDLLQECLLEEDYAYAIYYRKNLTLLEKTLYNLLALSDYNYAEKTKAQSIITNIEFIRKSEKSNDNFMTAVMENRFNEFYSKLDVLNKMPVSEIEEKYDIENAIINLLEKKINGFKIFTLKQLNLYLDFTLVSVNIIHIEFTPFDSLHKEYSFNDLFHNSEIEILKLNGFKLNEGANIFYNDFNMEGKSTQTLMIFLSKLFLEILHWHERKNFQLLIY